MIDRGKPEYSDKICPSATSSSTNVICSGLGFSPVLRLRGRRITDCAMARPLDNAKQLALEVFCSLPG